MARRYRARVTMLHVMEIPSAGYPGWPAHAALIDFQAMIDDRKQHTQSFLKTEFEEIATTRVMDEGDAARQIVEYADKEKADLIMMPTHGYGPFRRFLLGSVTAKVLHDVKCPVWTSAHAPEAPALPTGYRDILCAVDLTPNSLPLVQWASGFARDHGAQLKLVHAVPAAEPQSAVDIEGGRFRAFLLDVAREEMTKLQKQAGTELDAVLRAGDVAQVVREAAEEEDADLVLIGRGVMHELLGRMRTHVYSVIREAPCPVISV
jgi:nucleotide-binding universal stress UspA family protein